MDLNGSHAPSRAPDNGSLDQENLYQEDLYQEDLYQEASQVLILSLYILVCCVGLGGNAMVIYVLLRHAVMKTPTNLYILNLAVADVLFLLSVPFLAASAALRRWPFGPLMCRLVLSADAVNMFTSVFCLTVLSADRYLAVVHPAKATRYRRPPVAMAVNVCVWGLSLLAILPVAIFADVVPAPDGGVDCNFLWPEAAWSEAFVVYTFLLGFLLPVGAIGLCYCLMATALSGGGPYERRVTRMVLLLAAIFVLCWMPFYVAQLVSVFHRPPDPTLTQLLVILSYANSAANPFLYGSTCWLGAGLGVEQEEGVGAGLGVRAGLGMEREEGLEAGLGAGLQVERGQGLEVEEVE